MANHDDETASIDLSVAFFSTILMLFVFVAFNLDDAPRDEVEFSIGQTEETIEVIPPAWSALNKRGSFALLSAENLTFLNLTNIAAGMITPKDQFQGENGYRSYSRKGEPAPNAFQLTLNLLVTDIPEAWRGETLAFDGPCPESAHSLVTIILAPEVDELSAIQEFAARCNFRTRYEQTSGLGAEGWITFAVGLSESAYSAERMFR